MTLANEPREDPFRDEGLVGRPSKIVDPAVRETLRGAIALGASINQAASAAGIDASTFRRWRIRAEAEEEPYQTFFGELLMERDVATVRKLQIIDKAAQAGTWQAAAWWLERNFPDEYGQRTRHEVTGKDGTDLTVRLVWPD